MPNPAARGTDAVEAVLADWVLAQRRQQRSRRLTEFQRDWLALGVPGWSWEPRDDRWDQLGDNVIRFAVANGALPRERSTDPAERRLGEWWRRQNHDRQHDLLTPIRAGGVDYIWRLIAPHLSGQPGVGDSSERHPGERLD